MKKTLGEALDASKEGIERFSQILKDLILKESLDLSQIYNTDKTSLFYHFWPMNTLDDEKEKNLPGWKLFKWHVSALLSANASVSHHCKPVVVGHGKQPLELHGLMDSLPVIWYHLAKACFIAKTVSDWFHNHFIREVSVIKHRILALLGIGWRLCFSLTVCLRILPQPNNRWQRSHQVHGFASCYNCTSVTRSFSSETQANTLAGCDNLPDTSSQESDVSLPPFEDLRTSMPLPTSLSLHDPLEE